MAHDATAGPQGLGGWMILILIGLVLSPFRIALSMASDLLPLFTDGTWDALTNSASEHYHPLWAPLILGEIVGNVILIALPLVTLVFVIAKSWLAPRLAITWLATTLLITLGDFLLAQQIPMIAEMPVDMESVKEIARAAIAALIWIPYFLVSRRVRATFVEPWPRRRATADAPA
jgi:hypothetical protein